VYGFSKNVFVDWVQRNYFLKYALIDAETWALARVRFAHPTEQQTNSVSTDQAAAVVLNSSDERRHLRDHTPLKSREEQGIKAQWN